ncbi:MAG TPA: DUF1801 domain-containing protein [Candidatus Limnocylindria bacterium]|jgi:hypothetical protein|nr:DUF1801 domain-containing protein [Candidatus Limnocylindria bacterium]
MNGQKTVDEYIAAFDDWRTDAMKRLREVVKEGAPHSAVAIKWAQPVWEWNGPMIWMKAYPKHVDIGFWRGTEMDDPKKVLTGDGERMRHIKITSVDDIPADALVDLVKQAVKLNTAKGNPTLGR